MIKKNCAAIIFALAVFFSFTLFSFAATWYNDYETALKAVKKKDWQTVERYTRYAIKYKKEPKLRSRTVGLRFVDYLPYYYRGLAYYQMGQFEQARAALTQSLDYGEIRKKAKLHERLQQMLGDCRKRLSSVTPETQTQPKPKTVSKDTKVESKDSLQITQSIAKGDQFRQAGSLPAAKEEYIKARKLIEQTGQQVSRLVEVNRKIREITKNQRIEQLMRSAQDMYNSKQYAAAENALNQVLVNEPGNEKARRLLNRVRQARQAPADTGKPGKPGDIQPEVKIAVEQLMNQGERLFREGKFEDARKKFSAVLQLAEGHAGALEKIENVDYSLAVRNLNNGIKSYFEGEHGKSETYLKAAIRILLKEPGSAPPRYKKSIILACQFLAIVLIEKHYLGDDVSGDLLKEARQWVDEVFSREPGFELEEEYFSPKVVIEFSRMKRRE